MLRQDGKAFPIKTHIYAMGDSDLSSEADAASFIQFTHSKDIDLCRYILDCWMCKLIEDDISFDADEESINDLLRNALNSLPYHFPYPLSTEEYIKIHIDSNNFYDIDSYYEFLDEINENLSSIQTSIRDSLNQQFCRVRYGGQYDTGNSNSMWFRVSSVGYNWANTIYVWLMSVYRKYRVQSVFICRDYESDYGDREGQPEYFYKAKDGTPYFNMPIAEYFNEEHEHSPVFSNNYGRGVLANIKANLSNGFTFEMLAQDMIINKIEYGRNIKKDVLASGLKNKCINCSEYFDNLPNRTKNKFSKVFSMIRKAFPEVQDIDVDKEDVDKTHYKLIYDLKYVDHSGKSHYLTLDTVFNGTLDKASPDIIFRKFRQEFGSYLKYTSKY